MLAEFQRSRLLRAALEEACEHGRGASSVASIVARARVSRKTFYQYFDSHEACFAAVFEECVARVVGVVAPAYAGDGSWPERLRAALVALMALLECEPDVGSFALAHVAVDDGRCQPGTRRQPAPLTAEVVVGGVLAVIHARLRVRPRHLGELVNQLMWMIVLPYLGPAAAARELRRGPLAPAARPPAPARGLADGLELRMTYRTARVLAAIAEEPGASNTEIAARVEVTDQGQISRLLARLAHLGLIENSGSRSRGAANAWRLTPRGSDLDAAFARRLLAGASRQTRRRDV